MTIYQIKVLTLKTSPYFFTRETLKFFGQKMSDFKVSKQSDGRYKITAPTRYKDVPAGQTVRYFNPLTNELELQ